MKKLLTLLVLILGICTTPIYASKDIVIQDEELPQAAKEFIKKHFSHTTISLAKAERDHLLWKKYEVILTNGDKLEFDSNGQWKEIKCKYNRVPDSAVPTKIKAFIDTHQKEAKIIQLEREKRKYKVELSNKLELKFNLEEKFIGYDD